jgi:hypothetical protein
MFKLIDEKSGKEIKPGDTVTTFRGDPMVMVSFTPPHKPSSSGFVHLRYPHIDSEAEFYPSVIGAVIKEMENPAVCAKALQDLVITELVKHGWEVAPENISHVVIARLPVKTFKGMDYAKIHPVTVFEEGDIAVGGEFTSKGENVLALCRAYIKTEAEIQSKIAEFHAEVTKSLSGAFSVRMAT